MKGALFAWVLIVSLPACGKDENRAHQAAQPLPTKENRVVETLNDAELDQLLQQRNGKLLFLNIWATWCVPCKEEFPDLVRLAKEYQNRPVEFVGLSIDYPDEAESKIMPFLDQMKVNFKVYVQDFANQEEFIDHLNPAWSGALPATFIFDSRGKQKAFLVGKHSYQQFKQEIEGILRD